jgi:preprotein translocase SecE subunit
MARTRQKAKQRKAKRLEEERKAAERSRGGDGRRSATQQAASEVEEAQQRAAEELAEAQRDEVGAGAEAARTAAAAEAAMAAEVATGERTVTVPKSDEAPPKPARRERRKAEPAPKEKAKPKPARAERKREARTRGRVVNFFIQVWAELRRVQWPDRSQVTQATAVVIVFCVIAGTYLGIWDFLFNKLVKALL